MIKSKKIKVLIISILCILTITIGLSYGYYLLSKVQENNNIAGSKCFKLEFSNESEAINLSNMYPISDEEGKKQVPYSFTITNTCDMLAGYTVNMEMLEGTTLNSKYLDVLVNNEEIKLLSTYEATDTVIANSTESRILTKGTLAYNDSVDYTVRFWMDKDVEDIESMNKYFTSKIVVVATPSTWNSKDAGYDTLHDAILANEYQTTPEIAKTKIASKQAVDVTNTAPVINWIEKTGSATTVTAVKPAQSVIETYNKDTGTGDKTTQASDLTLNDTKLRLFKTKTFNSDTARYSLSDPIYVDPTTLDYSGDTKYYFKSESIHYDQTNQKLATSSSDGDITIYQVTVATKTAGTTTWNSISYDSTTYKLSATTLTETELETDKSDKGLYQGTDDYGTTYYYRGNVKNNIVYFAGYYWQIIRINGDGTIRLLYNGTEKNASGVKQSINNETYQFNSLYNDPTYVGYMYGDKDGTTFAEVHNNTNNSTIKTAVDNWYKTNIADKGYSSYISNAVGFCGDRSLPAGVWGTNDNGDGVNNASQASYFGAYIRSLKNVAQFTCPEPSRDLYTTTDSNIGNKALTYPVGLITYDELVFAGMDQSHINKLSWAYSTQHYWTMSPSTFSAAWGNSDEWSLYSAGSIYSWWRVDGSYGARPVINLKADVRISGGTGTANEPYVID